MKLAGIKLNITTIVIIITVLLLLIILLWYFYKQGKKQVTLQYLPGELPGNASSGNTTGASNDEIKNLANALYTEMDGWNLMFGHNLGPYNQANLLNDSDIVKLYNTFNALYQKESGETLTQWLKNEQMLGQPGATLIARLQKLNCL